MKKKHLIGILLIIITIIVVVGLILLNKFNYEIIECSNDIKGDKYTINNTYKIYHNNNEVKKVLITKEVKSKNNTILSYFEKNYKDEFKKYNKEYGGYKIDSNIDKNTMTLEVELKMEDVDISKLTKEREYLKDSIKEDKMYVEGIYRLFNLSKNSCK